MVSSPFLSQMPSTVEELEGAIQDTESEANSMLFLNQNVLQEYQNRQREVQQLHQLALLASHSWLLSIYMSRLEY
jgi:hypothetical protein